MKLISWSFRHHHVQLFHQVFVLVREKKKKEKNDDKPTNQSALREADRQSVSK